MATSNNSRDVKMTLSVETLGDADIKKLQTAVAGLAKEGGDAAPEFQHLADEIGRIGEQAAALQTFTQLSEQTGALAQRQEQAAASAADLQAKLDALSAVTQEAAARQQAANTALDAAKQAARATRDELATLTATTDRASKAEAAYASEVQRLKLAKIEQRAEIERLSASLVSANRDVAAAEAAEARLATTYDKAARAATSAGQALEKHAAQVRQADTAAQELGVTTDNIAASQAELVQALNRTGSAADALQQGVERLATRERELAGIRAFEEQVQAASRLQQTAEYARLFDEALKQLAERERTLQEQSAAEQWQREAVALVDATHAAQAMARETDILVAAQRELAAQRAFEKQAQDASAMLKAAEYVRFWREELDKAEAQAQRTAEEARLSAERISSAFSTLGVRSAQDLQTELVQVRAAMETVRTSAGLTGGALDAAFAAGNQKIAQLERDIRQVSGTLTTADRAASLFKNSLGQIAAGNIIADGVGYLVNKVKELAAAFVSTIVQTEQLRRGLNAVYQNTAIVAAQFDFLKKTANSAGVAVGDIQQSFVKFSAATKASGVSLQVTNDLFAQVTRTAGALGLSGEQVSGMLEALSQMASKGTVSMEELRQQLGDRLPGALSLVAKGLGLTDTQLNKLVASGDLAARDLFPALTSALKTMHGETDGLLPSWSRLKNVLTETAQNAGDSGWTQMLTIGLQGLAAVLGVVILPLSFFSEVIFGSAKAAAVLVGAIVTLTNPMEELKRIAQEGTDRQAKLTQSFRDAAAGTTAASAAASVHVQKMTEVATAAATATLAVASTAKAQEAQAFAAKLAADNTLDLGSKLVQLKVYYNTLLSAQENQIDASGKLVKAAKIEGDSLVQLAELRGQESVKLDAQATAAEKVAATMATLATAHQTETELLTLKRDEIIRVTLAQDGNLKSRQAEIDAINLKINTSKTETEQANQSSAAAQREVEIRRLAVQAYADNSARVGEFQKAVAAAQKTLDAMVFAEEAGMASAEDLAKAQGNVAKATFLLNDALKDTLGNLDRESRLKQANTNLTIAKMNAELGNIHAMAEAARASGNYELATQLEIDARRKQIEIIKATILAKEAEAQATIKALEIERAALDQSDPLLKQKQAEIDIRLANAKAKLIEAGAGKDVIASLEREIALLRDSEDTRKRGTEGIDRDTDSRRKNAQAVDKQTEALQRQQKTADGFVANKDGSAAGQFGNSLPLDQVNAITDKLHDGTLSASDLGAAQEALRQATDAKAWLDALPQGSVSYDAITSAEAKVREAQQALARVQALARGGADGGGGFNTGPISDTGGFSAGPSGSADTGGFAKTVNITINGRNTAVNVASATDATALTSVLRQLESASGAAS